MGVITFFPGGSKLLSHLVKGDVNDLIDIKDRNAALEICQGALNTIMNLGPGPHISIFKLF